MGTLQYAAIERRASNGKLSASSYYLIHVCDVREHPVHLDSVLGNHFFHCSDQC